MEVIQVTQITSVFHYEVINIPANMQACHAAHAMGADTIRPPGPNLRHSANTLAQITLFNIIWALESEFFANFAVEKPQPAQRNRGLSGKSNRPQGKPTAIKLNIKVKHIYISTNYD